MINTPYKKKVTMERTEIIKALECCYSNCDCDGCPNSPLVDCRRTLERDAIALIKELTEKIDDLEFGLDVQGDNLGATREWLNDAECKVEKLTEENEDLKAIAEQYRKQFEDAKADTVRKMHELIKERCIKGGIYPAFVASTIDQIAKEMLDS